MEIGERFDPLAGVTAQDAEDGEITLTEENIIDNDVDTSKAGTYHVTYRVTDQNGASTEKTITVTIKKRLWINQNHHKHRKSRTHQEHHRNRQNHRRRTNLLILRKLLSSHYLQKQAI